MAFQILRDVLVRLIVIIAFSIRFLLQQALVALAPVVFIFAIPTNGFALVAIFTGKTAGMTWNAYTITVAVVVGCVLFAILMYLMALVSVPAIVFFPAYSIYFFAPRYPALSLALYPPPPPDSSWNPDSEPPQQPPPLLPSPEPIG